jgi:hypothetical protein
MMHRQLNKEIQYFTEHVAMIPHGLSEIQTIRLVVQSRQGAKHFEIFMGNAAHPRAPLTRNAQLAISIQRSGPAQ